MTTTHTDTTARAIVHVATRRQWDDALWELARRHGVEPIEPRPGRGAAHGGEATTGDRNDPQRPEGLASPSLDPPDQIP